MNLPAKSNQLPTEIQAPLERAVELVESVLPTKRKGQAERYVKRAGLYFSRQPQLKECSIESFVTCVVQAAELGLAIDGRLAHAVKHWNKHTGQNEAVLFPDYKGLVAIGIRNRRLSACWAKLVGEADEFSCGFRDGEPFLEHVESLQSGKCRGAYAILKFSAGGWVYEYMTLQALEHVRGCSKKKDSGPWLSFRGEMYKKTVLRRALKLHCYDDDLADALAIDEDAEFDDTPGGREPETLPGLAELTAGEAAADPSVGEPEPADEPDPPSTMTKAQEGFFLRFSAEIQAAADSKALVRVERELGKPHMQDILGRDACESLGILCELKRRDWAAGEGDML